ncbi:DUF4349 domain-containing protein [Ferruginibacter sp. SUN106]|uniref:DUF4349 domain-containing protein n=1 Tax=Ferruginibacter sp. SUN106 TaxID=2978348 RepID=UPI003D3606EB
MKTKLIIAAAVCFSIFISCNHSAKQSLKNETVANVELSNVTELKKTSFESNRNTQEPQQIPVGTQQQVKADSAAPPPAVTSNKPAANPDWDKKIIKTATLKLEVKDFKGYNDNVHKTVKQFGGYIAQEEQNLTDEKSETVISIKVPVDQFETMMNQLPGADIKVLERKINTEDVTGQVVDTRSRLEAKKQMRLKYLEFLKQSKNMEEVLQVQNEINSIQEEIESAAGRVEFLSHQSAYSTINLTFFQPLAGYKPTDDTPTFFTRISHAFKTGASWFADLFVGLISIWPLLLAGIGIYIGVKKIKFAKKPVINA